MNNPEMGEIVASVQAAISRAYALGRLDALKHVVTAIEAEELGAGGAKPLALSGPRPNAAPAAAPIHEQLAEGDAVPPSHKDLPANDDRIKNPAAESAPVPWYMRAAN